MALCPLTSGAGFSCSAKVQGGIYEKLFLYNFDDWKLNTVTREVDGTISDITNASGKEAYDFAVADSGNLIVNSPLRVVSGGADGYDHQIDSKLFLLSQAALDNLSGVRFTKVVAIVQRMDGTALLYGEGVGMLLEDFQYNPGDAALGGVASFVLKTSSEEPPENELPVVIDAGSAALTTTLLATLTTEG